jgi:hypothetical protein
MQRRRRMEEDDGGRYIWYRGMWRTLRVAEGRAPERWEWWERVPSQFEILAATFG